MRFPVLILWKERPEISRFISTCSTRSPPNFVIPFPTFARFYPAGERVALIRSYGFAGAVGAGSYDSPGQIKVDLLLDARTERGGGKRPTRPPRPWVRTRPSTGGRHPSLFPRNPYRIRKGRKSLFFFRLSPFFSSGGNPVRWQFVVNGRHRQKALSYLRPSFGSDRPAAPSGYPTFLPNVITVLSGSLVLYIGVRRRRGSPSARSRKEGRNPIWPGSVYCPITIVRASKRDTGIYAVRCYTALVYSRNCPGTKDADALHVAISEIKGPGSKVVRKRLPLVKIVSVPKTIDGEDLSGFIYQQNCGLRVSYTEKGSTVSC
ncbi:uncharacterized protein LOC111626910 isoform X2 [Centruroides sculpturatus]|uniref:uncharacterized protein LOC111626910 isoform X2 n=1 Tax=Centruroides sculpturatus TaxID=218467 RepID=UPI000C6DE361|nr:uncharacterized protein LOC111626910 isoform X2 [Centruroides sculpturatus]